MMNHFVRHLQACTCLTLACMSIPAAGQMHPPISRPVLMEIEPGVSRDGALWLFSGKPITGVLKRMAQDGVESLWPLLNGQVHGQVTSRFASGQRRAEATFVNGQAQGLHRAWWPNGLLQSEQSFKDDKPDGVLRTWYASGRPYQSHHYMQGQEEGPQRVWFEDQRLRANYVVRDGRRYGNIGTVSCGGGGKAKAAQPTPAQLPVVSAAVHWTRTQGP
jgi:hypothetical protein